MQKLDFITVIAIALCVSAGSIVGQSFSFEVKLSDLIALFATCITFYFAYSGLRHNRDIYYNSTRPLLYIEESKDHKDFNYKLLIKNCGTGPAVEIEYKLYYAGSIVGAIDFNNIMCTALPGAQVVVSTPSGYNPMESLLFLEIDVLDTIGKFDALQEIINKVKVELTYHSILNKQYVANFKG